LSEAVLGDALPHPSRLGRATFSPKGEKAQIEDIACLRTWLGSGPGSLWRVGFAGPVCGLAGYDEAMIEMSYTPGMRVRITQQIRLGTGTKTTELEGTVLRAGQQKTGSWFAHSKDKKLWLDRIELKKDDGEIVFVNLDQYSRVEALEPAEG